MNRGSHDPGSVDGVPTADESLLALIDRLAELADDAGLAEVEVEVGGTSVAVRTPAAAPFAAAAAAATAPGQSDASEAALTTTTGAAVRAPLTGIWYAAPAPGAAPYVAVGSEIGVGQVIGLIEAMKLFNEIKSDHGGRVSAVLVESGQLVKARQPLIEVGPL